MLWLSLHFPRLPLEIHARSCPPSVALALAETTGASTRLLFCNAAAHARGLRPGMTPASALAICCNAKIVHRTPAAEHDALENAAAWACQFTSQVSVAAPNGLLMEIGGSASLFGGIGRLRREISQSLQQLGYDCRPACAPTPQAALWFSRAGIPACIAQPEKLELNLNCLPVTVLESARSATTLQSFGIDSIGACLKLSRTGLARRLGQHTLNEIDRALGRIPDPRHPYTLPLKFSSRLELPAPAAQAEALLFAAQRLCAELHGYLAARNRGAQRLRWTMHHERRPQTRLSLELAAASRDPEHLLTLLRERLATTTLPQPVTGIELSCTVEQNLPPFSPGLHHEQSGRSATASTLLDILRARLGNAAVYGIAQHPDHRPERAWRTCDPEPRENTAAEPSVAAGHRPFWLLPQPQKLHEHDAIPHYDGPLTLLSGPERIEYGWWDDQPALRDYFIARSARQALLWIYRERGTNGRWFLHGFFS